MRLVATYGRVDDLYCLDETPLEKNMYIYLKELLTEGIVELEGLGYLYKDEWDNNIGAYEIFKWLKSENCSNTESKRLANKTREAFEMSHKEYRKTLSWGREKAKVLERLMSDKRFDEIEFDKIPSRAGLIYGKSFLKNPLTSEKYEAFINNKNTTVNADVLFPHEIVYKAVKGAWIYNFPELSDTDRIMIEKYWNALPNYLNGQNCKILCVCDTSASMIDIGVNAPLNVAIGLSIYCAERAKGPFKDYYISFSRHPQLVKIEGIDFVDKVRRIYKNCICENTDLIGTFEMLRKISMQSKLEDIPDTIVILSDMEIDKGCHFEYTEEFLTDVEKEKEEWKKCGLQCPKIVYWNLDARQNNFLDLSSDVSYVSGFSPTLFKQVLSGASGYELMLQTLGDERYNKIK